MAESIVVRGEPKFDPDGELVAGSGERVVGGCVMDPQSGSVIDGDEVVRGAVESWRVIAPPGTKVFEGEVVEARGATFTIVQVPFDHSVGRRPVLRRHRPPVVFFIERREA